MDLNEERILTVDDAYSEFAIQYHQTSILHAIEIINTSKNFILVVENPKGKIQLRSSIDQAKNHRFIEPLLDFVVGLGVA